MQLNLQLGELKTEAEDVKNRLKVFRKKSREVDNIKQALDTLQKKIDVIKSLELNRREPVRLMDAMTGMVIPKRMWFTDFSINNDAVVIKGHALDNKTVADFMTQLEKSGFFSTVNLTTLKQVTIQKVNVKGFEISCEKIPLKAIEEDKGKN
jgi:type IV pilus assembly protein PilN